MDSAAAASTTLTELVVMGLRGTGRKRILQGLPAEAPAGSQDWGEARAARFWQVRLEPGKS